jgi:methylmalonyl-CoA decarboxylase subunit alpha
MIRGNINAYKSAGWGLIDDVIDPRHTRRIIHEGLVLAENKVVERPFRRRAVMPV